VIDQRGLERRVYVTQASYSAVPQLGQPLAHEISNLLPSHPHVHFRLSYAQVPAITPGQRISLPRAGGGTIELGPSQSPRLVLFFDTWNRETTRLGAQLERLSGYRRARRRRQPAVADGGRRGQPRAIAQGPAPIPQGVVAAPGMSRRG